MPLSENNLIVHTRHYLDGFPLCWPMGQEGTFEASYDEGDVSCNECIKLMKE